MSTGYGRGRCGATAGIWLARTHLQVNERSIVMTTIMGMFDRLENADRAVIALEEAGFVKDNMLGMVQDRVIKEYVADPEAAETEITGDEVLTRSMVIGGLAGLLAGAGVSLIPNLGAVLRAGGLTTTPLVAVAGAGVGATIGSAVGAFTGLDVTEDEAAIYSEGVKRGHILVGVKAEGAQKDVAANILKSAGALDVDTRRTE